MSGFDTSRGSSGAIFRSKQFGSIMRGYGPPVPQSGSTGDLYIDTTAFYLYEKRNVDGLDDWGHYLFQVPSTYQTSLKWFGSSPPENRLGVNGDYFLQWAGYPNYGMQPVIWGPRNFTGWPENGTGTTIVIAYDYKVHTIGLADEGADKTDVAPNQLLAIGINDEYVIPFTITANPGDTILQIGLRSSGALISVTLNPLYTAEDQHAL